MSIDPPKADDILGIRPLARAAEKATDAAIGGAAAFLGRICLPAAEEFGLLLRDRVSAWRARNAARIAEKAGELAASRPDADHFAAHPRIVIQAIERGSWDEDEEIQAMWAGLIASSCSVDVQPSDENLIFVDLLSRITSSEARLLRDACGRAPKYFAAGGELIADYLHLSVEEFAAVSGVSDRARQHRELAHLHSLELLKGGFQTSQQKVSLKPSELGLHFVARCSGYVGDPAGFYGVAAV